MHTTVKRIVAASCLIGILLIVVNYFLFDAFALSLCAGGFVWIFFERRIENLKTRLAILEHGETALNESVEALGQRYNGPQYSGQELSKKFGLTHPYKWRIENVNQTDSSYSEIQVYYCR